MVEQTPARVDTMGDPSDIPAAPTGDPTRSGVPSPASDLVLAVEHPSHDEGGPCSTCAFRMGTEANQSIHTMQLARMCVEGGRPFYCHEHPGLCRGFVAALNLAGVPQTDDERKWREVNAFAADVLSQCIAMAAEGR